MAFKSYDEWKMEKELKEQFGPEEEVQVEEKIEREIKHIEISEDVKIPEKIGNISTPPPESFGMDDFLKEVEATLKGIDTPKPEPVPPQHESLKFEPEPIKSEPVPAGMPLEYYELMGLAPPEVSPELPPQYVESVTTPPAIPEKIDETQDVPPEISLDETFPTEIVIDTTNIPDTIPLSLEENEECVEIGPPLAAWDTEKFQPAGHTEPPSINWTEDNWKKIKGIGPKLAKKLVENGPYKGIYGRLEGLVSKPVFKRIKAWAG